MTCMIFGLLDQQGYKLQGTCELLPILDSTRATTNSLWIVVTPGWSLLALAMAWQKWEVSCRPYLWSQKQPLWKSIENMENIIHGVNIEWKIILTTKPCEVSSGAKTATIIMRMLMNAIPLVCSPVLGQVCIPNNAKIVTHLIGPLGYMEHTPDTWVHTPHRPV